MIARSGLQLEEVHLCFYSLQSAIVLHRIEFAPKADVRRVSLFY